MEKKFEQKGLTVVRLGSDNLPYDLLVSYPVEGTPFSKPTAISVKTRGNQWFDVIPPTKEQINQIQKQLQQQGFDFWIAFVKYAFDEESLHFEVYLTSVNKLDMINDFKKVTRSKGHEDQIRTENLIQKAEIKFYSR